MTAEEFEKQYAERSGTTVEFLREHGQVVMPCICEHELCEGWQMVSTGLATEQKYMVDLKNYFMYIQNEAGDYFGVRLQDDGTASIEGNLSPTVAYKILMEKIMGEIK